MWGGPENHPKSWGKFCPSTEGEGWELPSLCVSGQSLLSQGVGQTHSPERGSEGWCVRVHVRCRVCVECVVCVCV